MCCPQSKAFFKLNEISYYLLKNPRIPLLIRCSMSCVPPAISFASFTSDDSGSCGAGAAASVLFACGAGGGATSALFACGAGGGATSALFACGAGGGATSALFACGAGGGATSALFACGAGGAATSAWFACGSAAISALFAGVSGADTVAAAAAAADIVCCDGSALFSLIEFLMVLFVLF